jgi:hypothetical protein
MEKEYVGRNGKIVLYDDHLVIKRGARGFLLGGGMLRGDKTIPFGSIVAVQFKKSGMTLGYIQFTLMGGNEAKGGVMQSVTDENTVNFQSWGGDINKEFMELKNIVEEKIKQAKSTNSNSSSLDELEKLATLKEKGIVTEEEFQQKKKHLLSK